MNKAIMLTSTVFVCLVMLGNPLIAAEMTPPKGEEKAVGLASALASYGLEERDSLALATAARMMRGLSARVVEKGKDGAQGKAIDPVELLEKARDFAKGDDSLTSIIDKVDKMGSGGKWPFRRNCVWSAELVCPFYGVCFYKWSYVCF